MMSHLWFVVLLLALHTLPASAQLQAASRDYFAGDDDASYLEWYDSIRSLYPTRYAHSIFVDNPSGGDGAAVFWNIDEPTDLFSLAVVVRAQGWVGFGFSENGGMRGADVVTFEAATQTLTDSYILTELAKPLVDDCQSWTLVDSHSNGQDFLIFEAKRALDTNDTQDRIIENDAGRLTSPTRIILAWGDSSTVAYHGPNNRVKDSVILFDSPDDDGTSQQRQVGDLNAIFAEQMAAEAQGTVMLQIDNHPIPVVDTRYDLFCYSWQSMLNQGLPDGTEKHIIGIEAVIDPAALKYVHHLVISGSSQEWSEDGDCSFFPKLEVLYIWAAGEPPFALPEEAGFALDQGRGFKSFQLDIHYNNPWLDTNQFDSSGFRLYWTHDKRPYDMGVATFGDPLLGLENQAVGNGLMQHTIDCPQSCTTAALQEEATVVKTFLHMHSTGTAMQHDQLRNGEVVHSTSVEYFDYAQQGLFTAVEDRFTMLPGDTFRTRCFYESNDDTEFGFSSQQEMCIAFYFYYPRQWAYNIVPFVCGVAFGSSYGLQDCDAKYQGSQVLDDPAPLQRTFGSAPADTAMCSSSPPIFAVCLSGKTTVELESGERITMKDLELGTSIHVGNGQYEPVYSFGHYAPNEETKFLQFEPSGLEITSQHMVFVEKQRGAVPASAVRVGDRLVLEDGHFSTVTSIQSVTQRGLYAPFTPSGKLIVNGVQVSSYVSFEKDSNVLSVGGIQTPFTYQWLAHSFQFPHRLYCRYFAQQCLKETYTSDGLNFWVGRPLRFMQWLMQQHAAIVAIVMSCYIVMAGLASVSVAGALSLLLLSLGLYMAHGGNWIIKHRQGTWTASLLVQQQSAKTSV